MENSLSKLFAFRAYFEYKCKLIGSLKRVKLVFIIKKRFKKAEKQYKTLIRRAKDYPECKNWNDDIQNR